ncbi:MAG: dephospho-CoA kinase [Planctomycetes bacterium]|nr:dephospho-CoA kinase [Planctomycetota bacterium]
MIGLVGGVGSGKSSLARLLRDKHPIQIVEGDPAGHQVLTEPAIKNRLRAAFGAGIFTPQNEVDRRQVGQLVFGTHPDQVAARKKLESIVHPRISEILSQQVEQARQQPGTQAVILDAALMLETGWRDLCDELVFVDVPLEQRVHRVRENRGWNREQLQLREESQFPLERKRREADDVVDNSGDIARALSQLEQIFQRLTGPASR